MKLKILMESQTSDDIHQVKVVLFKNTVEDLLVSIEEKAAVSREDVCKFCCRINFKM